MSSDPRPRDRERTGISGLLRRGGRAWWQGVLLLVVGAIIGGLVVSNVPASGTRALAATKAAAAPASSVPTTSAEKLREHAIAKAGPATVEVKNVGIGLGTGVIISSDGYIVTNNHVVAGAHQLTVTLANGKTVGAVLRGTDPYDDLAVIKINATNLPTATFGNSSDLIVGQEVMAIGNPLGIVRTVTDGIVSALHRTVSEGPNSKGSILNAVQTSAAINPGNSGGALINLAGQVIGIPTLTAVDPQFNAPASGVGFAIPSNTVKSIAAQIMKYGKVIHSGRAALGVTVVPQPIDAQIAQQYNLPVDHGILIYSVTSNGPAAKAGLKKGDIIVKVDGNAIASYDDLLAALANKKPGDTAMVTAVTSQGKTQTYKVTLGELSVSSNG